MPSYLKYIREVITVEPILFCYNIVPSMASSAFMNLEFEIACLTDAGYSEKVCNVVSEKHENYTKEIQHVTTLVTAMHSLYHPAACIVPMMLVMFLGSVSDRRKIRKPFLLIPIVGELISFASCIIAAIFYKREWPLFVFGILESMVPSRFGSLELFQMAFYSYIADVSTPEMRTVRIGVLQIVLTIGTWLGTLVSQKLLRLLGPIGVLILGETIYLIGFLYGLFFIKESTQPIVDRNQKSLLFDACNPKNLKETFSLITKKIPGNDRLSIVVIMLVLFLTSVVSRGEKELFYYYIHDVYYWSATVYVEFKKIMDGIHCLGVFIGVALFVKIMKLSEYAIISIGLLDKIVGGIILFFSKSKTVLYLVICIQIATGVAQVGIMSRATKLVSFDNLGKALSLFGVSETIGLLLGPTLYKIQWDATSNPGTIFLLSSFLLVICMILIMCISVIAKKRNEEIQISDRYFETKNITYIQKTHI